MADQTTGPTQRRSRFSSDFPTFGNAVGGYHEGSGELRPLAVNFYVPSGASAISSYHFDVPAAGALDMFPGGQACQLTKYTSSVWGETATSRAFIGVYLDAFDDASSVGIIGDGAGW